MCFLLKIKAKPATINNKLKKQKGGQKKNKNPIAFLFIFASIQFDNRNLINQPFHNVLKGWTLCGRKAHAMTRQR
eukprot:m.118892 g.118892  ORF g.118892 m.118892 type:complete len:75 (+) comp9347_c0_seq1:1878-2102(+)